METALITGASNGIGLEMARIFAGQKINLILVARSKEKLEALAKELSVQGISVKVIVKDLSIPKNAEELYAEIKAENNIVNYLVNNAGFGVHGAIDETDWARELEMLNLNIISLTYLSKVFASDMKRMGRGRILNVGSTGSFQPGPYMAGYCATKAFVLSFSEAINYELKKSGVTVTTLCPGVTDTGFHTTAQTMGSGMFKSLSHATAADVARYGYKLMMKGRSMGVHGWANKFMVLSLRFTPRCIATRLAAALLR
jgi:uncharacterized protein